MQNTKAFTLIELSIVLIIIGLIVGGILVGRDLIAAAAIRSQLTQIEKFQQAVNTFKGKYGNLPGDICDPDATSFGFAARGPYAGQGDCSGKIQGAFPGSPGTNNNGFDMSGESGLFWVDLSTAKLIDGSFTLAAANTAISTGSTSIPLYLPTAKIRAGRGSGYASIRAFGGTFQDNFFGICNAESINSGVAVAWSGRNGIVTPKEAYAIDSKVDDGMPGSGNVMPLYSTSGVNYTFTIRDGFGGSHTLNSGNMSPVQSGAWPASSTSCYDGTSDGDNTNPVAYSTTQSDSGLNCVMGFRMQ